MSKLASLPGKVLKTFWLARLLKNWREVTWALARKAPYDRLQFRNGVVLEGPSSEILSYLFQEIWISRAHNPPGYEIHAGDTVIDVGANIGAFATFAATRAQG